MPGPWPKTMAEIVNLNRARKAKGRAEKEKTAEANRIAHGTPKVIRKLSEAQKEKAADANRVLHGTPKAVRKLSEAQKNKAEQRLAGHRLETKEDHN